MTGEIFSAEFFLWSCLWQSTIFLAAGLLGGFLLRRRSARAHRVLLLAMMAAVIVPAASILVKHYQLGMLTAKPAVIQPPVESHIIRETTGVISNNITEHSPVPVSRDLQPAITGSNVVKFPWRSALLYAWTAVSLILAARLLVTFILGVRVLRNATPLDSEKIEQAIDKAKAKLSIRKQVQIHSSGNIQSPVIWCWRRLPVLLVPRATGLPDIDWSGVLCHELAHYKRRDHLAGLLSELAVCLLPWQLLLWLTKSRLISLSEQACDDWVVASGQSGTDYAESLLNLTPEGQMAFVPAVVRSKTGLAGRVRRILKDSCGNPRTGAAWALASSVIAICLAAAIAFAQTKPAGLTGTVKTKISKSAVIEEPAFPVTTIKGRILDPNNKPAYSTYGVHIAALPVTSYVDRIWSSNEEGYFELPWSPTWVEKGKPIYLMAVIQDPVSQAALVEVKDPTSPVTVRLEPAFAITGKVVDPNGQEIEECLATISLASKFKCQALIYSTRRGKWWERMLSPLPYGAKYKLNVWAKGYKKREIIVDGTDRTKKLIDLGAVTLQPQDPGKPDIMPFRPNAELAEEFHEIYRLDSGEIIKFIKAPYVLGRQEYLFQLNYESKGFISPDLESGQKCQIGFKWGSQLQPHCAFATASPRLSPWVLRLVLDIPEYDFDIPKALNIHIPYGDWIVRSDSPRSEQLRCLEQIIYAETKRAIHFEQRTVQKDVIVASGRYKFKPHPSGNYADYIPLWDGRRETSEYTAPSLKGLFDDIEWELKMKIVDETEPVENATIRYRWIKRDPEPTGDKLSILLNDLAKTTSLQFKLERRPRQIWFVTEKSKN
jgi:beta-lactamase regulating signal transducer with metallopeptidase domain